MKSFEALKILRKDNTGAWCIPKKDTPEYKVVDINEWNIWDELRDDVEKKQ